jgi:hypothetical protein
MKYYDLLPKLKKNPAYALTVPEISLGAEVGLLGDKDQFPNEMGLFSLVKRSGTFVRSPDLSKVDTLWLDFQPNQFGWPLMSEALAEIVKQHLTGEEGIGWFTANVQANGESRIYHIPRFSRKLDVLDLEKTNISPSGIFAVAYFASSKIARYAMFHCYYYRSGITASLVVNEALMDALQKAKLTGMQFNDAKTTEG